MKFLERGVSWRNGAYAQVKSLWLVMRVGPNLPLGIINKLCALEMPVFAILSNRLLDRTIEIAASSERALDHLVGNQRKHTIMLNKSRSCGADGTESVM